jgi:DNA-binding CsgD family transcriptional regulator
VPRPRRLRCSVNSVLGWRRRSRAAPSPSPPTRQPTIVGSEPPAEDAPLGSRRTVALREGSRSFGGERRSPGWPEPDRETHDAEPGPRSRRRPRARGGWGAGVRPGSTRADSLAEPRRARVDRQPGRRAFRTCRGVRISSVPLRQHREIVGVFGLACPARAAADGATAGEAAACPFGVTARQFETLELLAGLGTSAIASRLGVAEETARNHIRGLLRQLGVHSRLEAVVLAYRLGLVGPPRDV